MFDRLRKMFGKGAAPPRDDAREHFAAEVEKYLRSLPNVELLERVPNELAFDVKQSGGGQRRVFLDNAFAETREMSPEQRAQKIAFFFGSVGKEEPRLDSFAAARDSFVPVLRGATYGAEIWMRERRAAFVRDELLPYVDVIVAIDSETSMSFVGRGTVESWKVSDDEILAAAYARLPLLANPKMQLHDEAHGPLWMVASDDSYESSRLLVPGWLASFEGKVEGRPIAIIPERAMLLVGGDARPQMIERLLDKADREFGASNRRLSPAIYSTNDAGEVVPYVRKTNDELAQKIAVAHEKLAIYEHDTQKRILDALHEERGEDVFVANYKVFGRPDGSIVSIGTWTRGAHTYLPRTDKVVLVVLGDAPGEKAKKVIEVPFEAIEHRLKPVPGIRPLRYETSEFPSDEELRALEG